MVIHHLFPQMARTLDEMSALWKAFLDDQTISPFHWPPRVAFLLNSDKEKQFACFVRAAMLSRGSIL